MSRADPRVLRAAMWALRSLRRLRRPGQALGAIPSPPPLPDASVRGVKAALRRGHATCLESARIRQAWDLAQGKATDVVIGVSLSNGFGAHAWREPGTGPGNQEDFVELTRLRADIDLPS